MIQMTQYRHLYIAPVHVINDSGWKTWNKIFLHITVQYKGVDEPQITPHAHALIEPNWFIHKQFVQ